MSASSTDAVVVLGMPRLSDSMEQGTIVAWLAEDGATVAVGDELAEVETDKATVAVLAEVAGVLSHLGPAGTSFGVDEPFCRIEKAVLAPQPESSASEPRSDATVGPLPPDRPVANAPGATPTARRAAASLGVSLALVPGTGPRGRITKDDVERFAARDQAPASASVDAVEHLEAPGTGGDRGPTTYDPLSSTQQIVARRMAESKAAAPDFAVDVDVDMEAVTLLREQLRSTCEARGAPLPSFNDFVVKAAALALAEHPRRKRQLRGDRFATYGRVNVGVAVAGPDALVVPTVFDADRMPLVAIARMTKELAERGRTGALTPAELGGGTFTVSNLGMFGVRRFTAIVNPPQAATLPSERSRSSPRWWTAGSSPGVA